MTLTDQLKSIRKKILFSNLSLFFWKIYGFSIVLFLGVLMLENIFYLSVEARKNFLFFSTFTAFSYIIAYLVYIAIASRDLIGSYKLSTIALKIGNYSFNKKESF